MWVPCWESKDRGLYVDRRRRSDGIRLEIQVSSAWTQFRSAISHEQRAVYIWSKLSLKIWFEDMIH